jgi:hypothetical protein
MKSATAKISYTVSQSASTLPWRSLAAAAAAAGVRCVNAALLCEGLVNDVQVFSVDIDPELMEAARRRLGRLGYRPTLATADGAEGFPAGAPYDRIISTCSLPTTGRPSADPGANITD